MCQRGDIYWAELPEIEGSQLQAGLRPVVLIANNAANENSPTFQCVPLTSRLKKESLPVHVILNTTNCLKKTSMALVEQETSIDKHRLRSKIGTVSDFDMFNIDVAILKQHGINPFYIIKRLGASKVVNK